MFGKMRQDLDPEHELEQTIVDIVVAGFGHNLTVYRADVPDFIAPGSTLAVMPNGQLYLKPWKDGAHNNMADENYIFVYHTKIFEDERIGHRFAVEVSRHMKFAGDVIRLHLDFLEAGIKAPLYLKEAYQGWVSYISFQSEADAVLAAAVMTINDQEDREQG